MSMAQEDWQRYSVIALAASLLVLQAGLGQSQTTAVCTATNAPATAKDVQQVCYSLVLLELMRADQEYKRYRMLYQEGAVSRQALDERASAYQLAQARYAASVQRDRRVGLRQSVRNQSMQERLAAAEAMLQLTQATYIRSRFLYQEGAISAEQLSYAAKNYAVALSERDKLQKQVRSRR